MSNSSELRTDIIDALRQCDTMDDFTVAAQKMLNTLGYRSDRTAELPSTAGDFVNSSPNRRAKITKSEERFVKAVKSIHIIFQYTSHEIPAESDAQFPLGIASPATFEGFNAKSFLFIAVELQEHTYARGQYAEYTREINKRLAMPVVVLFCTPADATADRSCVLLTLSFVGRRPSKTDKERDVLQKVSLLRDINCATPHRGHVDILAQLSWTERLNWIEANKKPQNFDGLLAAWLDELDTEALNKRFYKELFAWFKYAQDTIILPKALHARRADWIIRLITRLLFIWFIKEKDLVDRTLFIEKQVEPFLKGYDSQKGDSYYRAILQNLFFATLNTPIADRRFSRGNHADHRNPYLYRYKREIADDRIQDLLDCFACTPFVNGGLFDSLDDFEGIKAGGKRVDHFSDAHSKYVSVPNHLFFSDQGLITLFERYKFTVEENTPIEQEVALDPELLGKVFENLLASYNQKTQKDVRKQTGSYYTPRPIVNYMVRQALVERLATITTPSSGGGIQWRERLHALLDYTDRPHDMTDAERDNIIAAIANIKIFDPAAGSGAFLMGVLHQLVQLLDKLDPHNTEWRELQKKRATTHAEGAFETEDQAERDKTLTDISDTFERYSPRFGRKLFLIQNSIFGADIQPVACQIAKLRFFISLTIEQTPDRTADNLGIRPLPNLETRFVVTDTLIPLSNNAKDKQMDIGEADAHTRDIKQQLTKNRERHFNATNRNKKRECRRHDKTLRRQLADALEEHGFGGDTAQKIAHWDPYDQNSAADWFSTEYMFGIRDGFDIVIGNPPYVQLQADGGRLGKKYEAYEYKSFAKTGDVYMLFYEKGLSVCRENGILMFITSNSWLQADYGQKLRGVLTDHNPHMLINVGKDVFDNVYVDANILSIQKEKNRHALKASDINQMDEFPPVQWVSIDPRYQEGWIIASADKMAILAKIKQIGIPLEDWNINIFRGITAGYDKAFVIDRSKRDALIADDSKNIKIIKPTLRGRSVKRYRAETEDLYVITTFPALSINIDKYPTIKKHLLSFDKQRLTQSGKTLSDGSQARKKTTNKWFETSDTTAYYPEFEKEKLVWIQLVNDGRFAYDAKKLYPMASVFTLTGENIKYLLALLNSRVVNWQMRYISPTSGMGVLQWKKTYVEQLPIPKISKTKQRPFINLVNKIIAAKEADPAADTTPQENEIDQLVYQLYGLTKAEINIIEGA